MNGGLPHMTQNQNPDQSQNPNQSQGQKQKDETSCQVCGQSFGSDRELQEHMKTAHQNKGENQPGSERKQSDIDGNRQDRQEKIA
jgi:5-methylcytosine-specific restriction endonuclease McrA